MFSNNGTSEIHLQHNERLQANTSVNMDDVDPLDRLSRQESYELREAIRQYVSTFLEEQEQEGRQGRVTVSHLMQTFERCKEGFARGQLNEMVEEGLLISKQYQGMKVYFLANSKFQQEPDDPEDQAEEFIRQEIPAQQQDDTSEQIEVMAELLAVAIDKISELEMRLNKIESKPSLTIKTKLDRANLLRKLAQNPANKEV
jgi:hypothetical protein